MLPRSIMSPFCSASIACLARWLYRKQYLTPTMILHSTHVSDSWYCYTLKAITDQRFVNTTPKPRATKNSNGRLVGPLLSPLAAPVVDAAGGAETVALGIMVEVADDMMAIFECRRF